MSTQEAYLRIGLALLVFIGAVVMANWRDRPEYFVIGLFAMVGVVFA